MVRSDLPHGVQVAQIIHAAGESSGLSGLLRLPPGTRAVALSASPDELGALEAQLQGHGVSHVAIREPDVPYSGALMAIGLAPAPRTRKLLKLMERFRLVY